MPCLPSAGGRSFTVGEACRLASFGPTEGVAFPVVTHADDACALVVRSEQERLVGPALPRFPGREVTRIGDASLVELSSAQDARRSAP